ncbi:MAG: FAD-dependent oxidoreductase [Planctomycetes bacterium]|nr:FAD-dependent oxidoreductase [Planctomycetota bacterium]
MGKSAIDSDLQTMGIFEPHVAERVFEELVAEYNIPVHRNQWLDRDHGVRMNGVQIESIIMLSEQSRMQTTLQLIRKHIKQLRWR